MIPFLTLRTLEQNAYATYSQLVDQEEKQLCVTLENPWVDLNHDGISDRNVSCIPGGTYVCRRRYSEAHGCEVFEVTGVPGRDNVEMHIGCLPRDTKGCVLLGSQFGEVDYGDGKPDGKGHGVTGSHAAFKSFMDHMKGIDVFTLHVVNR